MAKMAVLPESRSTGIEPANESFNREPTATAETCDLRRRWLRVKRGANVTWLRRPAVLPENRSTGFQPVERHSQDGQATVPLR